MAKLCYCSLSGDSYSARPVFSRKVSTRNFDEEALKKCKISKVTPTCQEPTVQFSVAGQVDVILA